MRTLLGLWATFGGKVANGYAKFVEKVGPLSLLVMPFMLVGFTIPWYAVLMVLLGLDMLHGRVVYGLSFEEQWGWFKEGLDEHLHGIS